MPLIIPARQRALDAFPRSIPWILWVSIMHVCYIFLRDILIFILDGTNGSLPEYVRAIATDTALSEDVVPLLVLGGIFLVMPIISGAFIALVHLLMVRSPKWVQITAGAFTVLVAGAQLPAYLGCSGAHGAILAVFVVVTTSLERTARLLGRSRGDDIARFSDNDYEHAAALEGGIWNTAQDWVEEQKILEHRPLKIAPWSNLIIIPMIGQIIQATLFMLLVFGFFMGFSSIAISDTTIESWMSIKPEHLKILGVDTNINAVVIKVSMIVAVFSGLSFVATTSSDEKYARSFLKPMIEWIKHILIIRDIYLGLLTMSKNEVLIPLE